VLALLVQSAPAVPCSSLGRVQGPDVIAATAPVTDVLAIPAERTNGVVTVRVRDRLPEREPARIQLANAPPCSGLTAPTAPPAPRARSHPARHNLLRSDDPAPH